MQGMPQYTKEIQMYLNHMHIIDDCQKQFQNNVEKLCKGIFSKFHTKFSKMFLQSKLEINFLKVVPLG